MPIINMLLDPRSSAALNCGGFYVAGLISRTVCFCQYSAPRFFTLRFVCIHFIFFPRATFDYYCAPTLDSGLSSF
jgi:hypothetical protein